MAGRDIAVCGSHGDVERRLGELTGATKGLRETVTEGRAETRGDLSALRAELADLGRRLTREAHETRASIGEFSATCAGHREELRESVITDLRAAVKAPEETSSLNRRWLDRIVGGLILLSSAGAGAAIMAYLRAAATAGGHP